MGEYVFLNIQNSLSDAAPSAGDTISYMLNVYNSYSSAVSNVQVKVTIPEGLTLNGTPTIDNSAGSTFDPTTSIWTIPVINSNSQPRLTLPLRVSPGAAGQELTIRSQIVNAAPASSFNSGSYDEAYVFAGTPGDTADLKLNFGLYNTSPSGDSATTPDEGSAIYLDVNVENDGPSTATNVEVSLNVPANVTYLTSYSYSNDGFVDGSYNSATGKVTFSKISEGATGQVIIVFYPQRNTAGQVINLSGEITKSDQADPDSPPNNGVTTEDDYAAASLTVRDSTTVADLEFNSIYGYTSLAHVGDSDSFYVYMVNHGPQNASNVQIHLGLPDVIGLVSVNSYYLSVTYDPAMKIITIPSFPVTSPNSSTPYFWVSFTALKGSQNQTFTVPIEIVDSDQFDPDSTPNNGVTTEDDYGSTQIQVGSATISADLSLSVSPDETDLSEGDQQSEYLDVRNNGPDNATNIVINIPIPSRLTLIRADDGYDAGTGHWNIPALPLGGYVSMHLLVAPKAGTAGSNILLTATTIGPDQNDPVSGSASATATLHVGADLALSKLVSPPSADEGKLVQYTLKVTNNGPATTPGYITVADILPPGVTYTRTISGDGYYDPDTNTWNNYFSSSSTQATIIIEAVINLGTHGTTIDLASHFTGDRLTDNNAANDHAGAPLTVVNAANTVNLRSAVEVSDQGPVPGDYVSVDVLISNDGPNNAVNFTVVMPIPPGLDPASVSTSTNPSNSATYDQASGTWSVPVVNSGGTIKLFFTFVIPSDATPGLNLQFTAQAKVNPAQTDSNSGDDSANNSIKIATATLQLLLTKPAGDAHELDEQLIHATISNTGPSTARDVRLAFNIPSQLQFSWFSPVPNCVATWDDQEATFHIDEIASGDSCGLEIYFIPKAGTAEQTVTLKANVQSDMFDPNTANNNGQLDFLVQPATSAEADLELFASMSPSNVGEGDPTTYTVTLSNYGTTTATNIRVKITIPAHLILLSVDSGYHGSFDGTTGIWSLPSLAGSFSSTQLSLELIPDVGTGATTLTVDAAVAVLDQTDSTPAQYPAELEVTSSANGDVDLETYFAGIYDGWQEGQIYQYTLTAYNNSDNNATNVRVDYQIPAEVEVISAVPNIGSYNVAQSKWTIGTFFRNYSGQIAFTVRGKPRMADGRIVTHQATITSTQNDTGLGNNTDTIQQQLGMLPIDLRVQTTAYPTGIVVGATTTFTIQVTNISTTEAYVIQIHNVLPAGMTFVSASPDYNPATGIWTINDTLYPQQSVFLDIKARAEAGIGGTVVTDTASVQSSTPPDVTSGNNSDSADVLVITPPLAALGITTPQQFFALEAQINQNGDSNIGLESNIIHPVHAGELMEYDVTIHNAGPDAALGVNVHIDLPDGLDVADQQMTDGAFDHDKRMWTLDQLATNSAATLKLFINIPGDASGQTLKFTAKLDSITSIDMVLDDNQTDISVDIQPPVTPEATEEATVEATESVEPTEEATTIVTAAPTETPEATEEAPVTITTQPTETPEATEETPSATFSESADAPEGTQEAAAVMPTPTIIVTPTPTVTFTPTPPLTPTPTENEPSPESTETAATEVFQYSMPRFL